jgi:hypothetical protein
MNSGKYILAFFLLFSSLDIHAQKETEKKSDTSHLKLVVLKKDYLISRTDISKFRISSYNHKLYNPDNYRIENFNSFFIGWPADNYSQNIYKQYTIRHNFYNKQDLLNSYIYTADLTDTWFDPTNPTGATSAGEALILGSLNYIFYKVITAE